MPYRRHNLPVERENLSITLHSKYSSPIIILPIFVQNSPSRLDVAKAKSASDKSLSQLGLMGAGSVVLLLGLETLLRLIGVIRGLWIGWRDCSHLQGPALRISPCS